MDYSFDDLLRAYAQVGVTPGRVVFLAPDLRWLGRFEKPEKNSVLEAHFQALAQLADLPRGTLVVSTPSMSLCNTDTPFHLQDTPSEHGVLTEHIRQQPGVCRSFHPFVSHSALGRRASAICDDAARHCFGPQSAIARMIDLDALCVSVGLHPRFTCEAVHHVEMIMGVPYRYTKEFMHPVVRGSNIAIEPFYMSVWYRECDIKRNANKKIFDHFSQAGHKVSEAKLGRGSIYSYRLKDFVTSTVDLLKKDIFAWLDVVPDTKPYRN